MRRVDGEPVVEVAQVGGSPVVFWDKSLPVGTKLYTHTASSDKQAVSVPDGLLNHIVSMIDLHEKRGVVLAVHMQELAEHIGYEPKQEGE